MLPSLPEVIIVVVILFIIFGVGKLQVMGKKLGKTTREVKGAIEGAFEEEKPLDITPKELPEQSVEPKPGTQKQSVDDAIIEEPT